METNLFHRIRGSVLLLVVAGGVAAPVNSEAQRPQTEAALLALDTAPDDETALARAAGALASQEFSVREEAARILGDRGNDAWVPLLQQTLFDKDRRVRSAAIAALADIGSEDALSCLAVALADQDAGLREKAVYAVGTIGGPATIALLEQVTADQDKSVREAVAEVLSEVRLRIRRAGLRSPGAAGAAR